MSEQELKRLNFARTLKYVRPNDVIHPSVEIKQGAVIGNDGFGWIRLDDGTLEKFNHTGNVVIEKDVVIGSNTCIDRAAVGSTVIGEGTKLDNNIHVGHGAVIGSHCLIVAGAVIGGSCVIGPYTFIGMNASIKNKVRIGGNCIIGAGAVVLKDVEDDSVMIGNPARLLRKNE